MGGGKTNATEDQIERELIDAIQVCRKCRMCVSVCPTYEGWFTQCSMGRLIAINLHLKYGLGTLEELSKLLFACTSCRRCEEKCKMVSMGVSPADIIVRARQLLVEKWQKEER